MLKQSEILTDKFIQLSENYRLKSDTYKNKWIERKGHNGKGTEIWEKVAGYMPTYELLLWDFAITHTAKAELKSAHDIIEKIAEAERLVSEFAKAIGKELDNGKRTD